MSFAFPAKRTFFRPSKGVWRERSITFRINLVDFLDFANYFLGKTEKCSICVYLEWHAIEVEFYWQVQPSP
jgi:hypothetical protein